MIKQPLALFINLLLFTVLGSCKPAPQLPVFRADHKYFQYTGRVDFSDPQKPKFWSPGIYITARFKGPDCDLLINDEALGDYSLNYIEVIIDNKPPVRLQTKGKINTINIASGLSNTAHTVVICKDTESGVGYLEFLGLRCAELLPPPARPVRSVEYIGDSITSGTGSDVSVIACGAGHWYDQHNAYQSYGARTSRALSAQWQLTAVAGIGLIHSCCDMGITMPQVFDKMNLRANQGAYQFKSYQPDVVTMCLGQNDGVQDSAQFCGAYVKFIKDVRSKYPKADIVCLTSPMAADAKFLAMLKRYLTGVVAAVNAGGDAKVSKFFFSRSFNSGCDHHPDITEHALIARELTAYIKKLKSW
ncbi:SGNH/GDSL hydrolase family protein [Mucilaginibacter sp.]|uniref:SGNH/GDSL hydrolase family protein n=1 Tax=Mucilaginibacter sp. TaxID=1882438 RepID=UPI0035BC5425